MITGDNPLTACHVAKELRMTRKETTLILSPPNNLGTLFAEFDPTVPTLHLLFLQKRYILNSAFTAQLCIHHSAFTV